MHATSASLSAGSEWHQQAPDEILQALAVTAAGLTSDEAARRLAQHGPNELQESAPLSRWAIFLRQFHSLIIWILIAAGAVAGLLGESIDALAIFAIVLLNAVIGFYQEYSAERSIAALKKMTAPQAKVRRDGRVQLVPAAGVVRGDIVELEAGDIVPADARLLEASALKCVEAALTGESEAASKKAVTLTAADIPLGDRENMVFMGTHVATGQGRAVVVATAMHSELGRIAALISSAAADETSPLQKRLEAFGRILVWASLGIVAVLFVFGLIRGFAFFDLFLTSVSLAVAAIPEGLPAVVTVSLALGVMRMARRRALVRRLPAVETLGSTNVICTDKTGTLTVGEMTVRELYIAGQAFTVTGEGYRPVGQILFGDAPPTPPQAALLGEFASVLLGCNNAHLTEEKSQWKAAGDPTEGALLVAGLKAGGTLQQLDVECPKVREIPFDSDRKRRTVVRRLRDGKLRALINGAPDVLLERCTHVLGEHGIRPLTAEDRQRITSANQHMAARALRVLGSAWRDIADTAASELTADAIERDLVFVGLAGMHDPPRPEVREAVARCREAGIRVVMITGDHPSTAMAIARDLGIASPDDVAITGVELDKLEAEELRERSPHIAVYARVTAEHKLRIVSAWKARGAVVAMTGDGVNDAPAIKGADIGVAMGRTGTEVTKQASDMIVTDDNFASIVAAVEEGRGIYDNIRKTLQYLLAGNTGELLLMTVCVLVGLPVPLLPIHLLWINLVTDGLPALCLATDPIDRDVMRRRPRRRSEKITEGGFIWRMFLAGALTASVAFGVYYYELRLGDAEAARTNAFAVLVFAELLRSFGARSETKPLWRIPLFSNLSLAVVVTASFALQVWSHHSETLGRLLKTSSLPLIECLALLGIGVIPLAALELVKLLHHERATELG